MNLYVYYRVRSELAKELQARAGGMQQALSKRHGIATGLQRRPEAKDGQQTWMEIYNSVPAGFDAILMQAVVDANLKELIDGERHAEYFVSVSCA